MAKQKEFEKMDKECNYIKHKAFKTKDDELRVVECTSIKILMEKEFMASAFMPNIERLSSILQCFSSIAQKSLDGAILLFKGELLLYLTNCAIFKSKHAQFTDPYLIDSGEENPCNELWCKSLELITYLLRQTCQALKQSQFENDAEHKVLSDFVVHIMNFCSVHHD